MMSLIERLEQHEGRRNLPYEDSEGNLTIGVGHNLSNPLPDHVIDALFYHDIATAKKELHRIYPGSCSISQNRQEALVELMFNMGAPTLLTFDNMWEAIMDEKWDIAADELLDSKWATQVGEHRSTTLAELLRDG